MLYLVKLWCPLSPHTVFFILYFSIFCDLPTALNPPPPLPKNALCLSCVHFLRLALLLNLQSSDIHIKGLIVSSYSADHSHWNSFQSLGQWLKKHNVPAIYGLDTRLLTKRIRKHGAVLGKIELPSQVLLHFLAGRGFTFICSLRGFFFSVDMAGKRGIELLYTIPTLLLMLIQRRDRRVRMTC